MLLRAKSPLFLITINRALIIILVISLGYLIYDVAFPGQKEELGPRMDSMVDMESKEESLSLDIKDYSAYSEKIKRRDLFQAPVRVTTKTAPSTPDLSSRFSLVGIMAGAEPQAIIEDKETQKTYYLYKGQSFNEVNVVEINRSKAILDYKGTKIILVL
ncbi:type II secretion system protein N [Candidatus Omnitrophota bacterium]